MNKKQRFEKAMEKLDNMTQQEFVDLLRNSGDTREYIFELCKDGMGSKELSFFAASTRPSTHKAWFDLPENKDVVLVSRELSEKSFLEHLKLKGRSNG